MPRIPTNSGQVNPTGSLGPGPGQAVQGANALARGFDSAANMMAAIAEDKFRKQNTVDAELEQAALTQQFELLAQELANHPSPAEVGGLYEEASNDLIEKAASASKRKVVGQAVASRGRALQGKYRPGVNANATRRLQDYTDQGIKSVLDQHALAFASSSDEVLRQHHMTNGITAIAAIDNDLIDEAAKQVLASSFAAGAQGGLASRLIKEAPSPEVLDVIAEAIDSDDTYRMLDDGMKKALGNDIINRKAVIRRQLNEARDAEVRERSNQFYTRIYDPDAEGGSLTVVEVANDPLLPATMKNHFISVLQREAAGGDTNKDNDVLVSNWARSIRNREPGFFLDPSRIGNGISIETFRTLEADKRRVDAQEPNELLFQEAIEAREQIIDKSPLGLDDSEGAVRMIAFTRAAREAFEAGIADSKDPVALLQPGPNGIFDPLIAQWRSTIPDAMRQLTEALNAAGAKDSAPVVENLPAHEAGQSTEDYLKQLRATAQ